MRTSAIIALLALATITACAQPAPEPAPEVAPLSVEPTQTGKYK